MAAPIKKEHAWGQTAAYSERVVHALPKSWQYGAFKVQKFLDGQASPLVNATLLGCAVCTVFLSKKRATALTTLVLEGIFAALYTRCYPTLLKTKENQFIRGSKADVAIVALVIGGVIALWSSTAARCQVTLFGILWLAELKHKNSLLETFEYVRGVFEQMGQQRLSEQLRTFKQNNPDASPEEILKALIQALKEVPSSCNSPLLEPLFINLEKHRAFIPKQELCIVRGSAKHVFLKERLRFIERSLYEKETLSLDPPVNSVIDSPPVSDSTKDACIAWLEKPTHLPVFISGEHAFEICRTANYLGAKQLEVYAARFIAEKLKPENFFSYFENARKYNLEVLFEEGLKYLVRNAEALLASNPFRVRLVALASTYKLGCVSYLLNPRAFPNFRYVVHNDALVLELNQERKTLLDLTEGIWEQAVPLLTNCVNNNYHLPLSLSIYACRISQDLLTKIYQCERIQRLLIVSCEKENLDTPFIASAALQSVSIVFSSPAIQFVPQSPHLQELKILHEGNFEKILDRAPNLKLLEVGGCKELVMEEQFTNNSSLERLVLSDIAFTAENFAAVCVALETHPLQRLDLGNCRLDEAHLKSLEKLFTHNKTLKVLTISTHGDERNRNYISYSPRVTLEEMGKRVPGRRVFIEGAEESPFFRLPAELPDVTRPPPVPSLANAKRKPKPLLPQELLPADPLDGNFQTAMALYAKVKWWVGTQKDLLSTTEKNSVNAAELLVHVVITVNEIKSVWLSNRLNKQEEIHEAIEKYLRVVQGAFARS